MVIPFELKNRFVTINVLKLWKKFDLYFLSFYYFL